MSQTLMGNLTQRRVPQIFGIYLGACWVAVEFADWLVERYLLSGYLVDLVLVGLLSLTPAVLMMAYFHGAPGKDNWERVEKIGVPVNLVVTVMLLVTLFHGKDLGAATTTVTVTDEHGQLVEKVLAKRSFRRRIALFFLDHEDGAPERDWLQYGITLALDADLQQDPFFEVWTPYSGFEYEGFARLRRSGYADGLRAPVALLREIAQDESLDYFLSGRYTTSDQHISINATLYETTTARLVEEPY